MPEPPVEVNWIDAKAVKSDDGSLALDQLEAARKAGKPVVILAITTNDIRRLAKAECERFVNEVLETRYVAGYLAQCTCLRVEVDKLPRSLRQSLGLSLGTPQLLISQPDGTKLAACDGASDGNEVAKALAEAINAVTVDAVNAAE